MQCDIRSFSSYTKGLHVVSEISLDEGFAILKLRLPPSFEAKLRKRSQKFNRSALSIDGVYAQVSFVKSDSGTDYFEVTAKVAKELFLSSTLHLLKLGDRVSIGMLSQNPEKWLLDSSPIGKVKLDHIATAVGHTHTKELRLECCEELFQRIHNLQYIGLNASGLLIREPHTLEGRYYFSIHVGQQTRERTVFGQDPAIGTEFTLTLPLSL